jgi:hypothetical protein
MIKDSPWIKELIHNSRFSRKGAPKLNHFVIITDEEIIEVASTCTPMNYSFYDQAGK